LKPSSFRSALTWPISTLTPQALSNFKIYELLKVSRRLVTESCLPRFDFCFDLFTIRSHTCFLTAKTLPAKLISWKGARSGTRETAEACDTLVSEEKTEPGPILLWLSRMKPWFMIGFACWLLSGLLPLLLAAFTYGSTFETFSLSPYSSSLRTALSPYSD
jgi:hypothetical protein